MEHPDWFDLINNDPDNFDRIAHEYIDQKLIEIAGDDKQKLWKLKKIQNKINKELDKYISPIARYNKMVEMFYEGFEEFNIILQDFKKKINDEQQ